MTLAMKAGEKAVGTTGDNPAVGCVVIFQGNVVAEGATQPTGGDHAEVVAIGLAEKRGFSIAECEVFVTLEPCAFQGKTPPCSTLIASKKPRRVVIATQDPHPQVRGKGIEELKKAGIETVVGPMEIEVQKSLEEWFNRF